MFRWNVSSRRLNGNGTARARGLTLLEVILSIGLTFALLAGVMTFYMTALESRSQGQQITRELSLTRSLLSNITEAIRHTTDFVPGDGTGFQGTKDRITIVRRIMPDFAQAYTEFDDTVDELPPAQLGIQRVTYQLVKDDDEVDEEGKKLIHGLSRTVQTTFDPNPNYVVDDQEAAEDLGEEGLLSGDEPRDEDGVESEQEFEFELIAPEIKFLEFEYFDGAEWRDRWQVAFEREGGEDEITDEGGEFAEDDVDPSSLMPSAAGEESGYALPQAVRITIGKEPDPEDQEEFSTSVLDEFDEEEWEKYHPDRVSVVVYLRQSDQSKLSSRQHGVNNDVSQSEGLGEGF